MNAMRYLFRNPGLRGAFFYAAYWGIVGSFEPFMNVYFLRMGIQNTQIGWLAAVLPLCTLALAPVITRLADRINRRVIFLTLACLGLGLAMLVPTLPAFRPTFLSLLGMIALFSIFRSPIIALADSLIAGMAAHHSLDFGAMRLWGSVIFTITAVSLGAVWARTGFTMMFLVAGFGFLPVLFAALLLEETPLDQPTEQAIPLPDPLPRASHGLTLADGRKSGLIFLLASTFLVIAALFMAGTFGAVYMTEIGGSTTLVGAMMGISALGEVPGLLFGRRVNQKLGDTQTLLLAYFVNSIGLAGYAFTRSPEILLIFSALRGLGFGLMLGTTVMMINTRAPRELASTYQGILSAACWGLAPLLGGPISGWVYQNFGPSSLFLFASGLTVIACVMILPTYRIWKTPDPQPISFSVEP